MILEQLELLKLAKMRMSMLHKPIHVIQIALGTRSFLTCTLRSIKFVEKQMISITVVQDILKERISTTIQVVYISRRGGRLDA